MTNSKRPKSNPNSKHRIAEFQRPKQISKCEGAIIKGRISKGRISNGFKYITKNPNNQKIAVRKGPILKFRIPKNTEFRKEAEERPNSKMTNRKQLNGQNTKSRKCKWQMSGSERMADC